MSNPMLECPDDTICHECGKKLPTFVQSGTPEWEGFCSQECRIIATLREELDELTLRIDTLIARCDRAETIADRCITGLEDILAARTTASAPLTAIRALKMGKKWQEKRNE